jgi:hypothetical protein
MYTGTLIEDLIQTVERTEERVHQEACVQETKLAHWYAAAQQELAQFEQNLAGVA